MGNRASIAILDPASDSSPDEATFLYAHWAGAEMPERLRAGLLCALAADRLDGAYLASILFRHLTLYDGDLTTGYGIGTRLISGGQHPILVLAQGAVHEYPEAAYGEAGFARLGEFPGVPFAAYGGRWEAAA